MNEQDRAEFERLKKRQTELLGEFAQLGRRLAALETRMEAAVETPAPKPTPVQPPPIIKAREPVVRETIVQKPEPVRVQPPPVPPAPMQKPPERIIPPNEAKPGPTPAFAQTRAAEPAKRVTPPRVEKTSFEMRLGTFWFVRIGIVMLLTGLVFFATYAYHNYIGKIGAPGKVGLLYLASGLLLGAGFWLQRKAELKNYAQVLLAGGLAAVYFTTYAAHHVPNLLVISSALLDGALLLGWAAFVIWLADRKKSEVLALFAVLLAYYTSVITHVGLFTLYSNLVLTAAAVFFLVRNRWATLSFASLAATYISYGFWRFYQDGHWQFVSPAEGLWTGNYFLMGYWAVFTGAVFLSRNEQFFGNRRAAFLSMNNAAFFSMFVFTMLQVHQGGYWKFYLIYGSVLVALSLAALVLLKEDKLCQNAYLTQGLLLVTLGFITYFTGLILSVVLATESVMLAIIGRQMKSRVLEAASMIAGLLAVGWGVEYLHPLDRVDLIKGAAIGAAMLFNAFWLRGKANYEQSGTQPKTLYYTALALGIWMYTSWINTHDEWRGAVIALETTGFLFACRPLVNQVLRYGSYLYAVIAAFWELSVLADQYSKLQLSERTGLAPGILLGAIMVFNAICEKSVKPSDGVEKTFRPPVTLFCSLGLFTWLVVTNTFTPHEYLAPVLAVEALLLTASFYVLRMTELVLFGQAFLIIGQAFWLSDSVANHINRPWWNPAAVIAITLGIAQWWQRQRTLKLEGALRMTMQGLYALAVVGLLYFWLEPHFAAPTWLAFASALAILLTAYAAINRYWLLALAGQIFVLVSGIEFVQLLWDGKPEWYFPLVPIATLCLLSFCAAKWFEARPDAAAIVRDPVLQLGQAYRIIALAMSLWWLHKYVPARELCWVTVAIGATLFAWAGWRKSRVLLIFSAVYSLVGIARFWFPMDDSPRVYLPNLFAILALLAQQRFARRLPQRFPAPAEAQTGVIVLGSLSLWFLLSRWIIEKPDEFYLTLTAGWAVLALVLFMVGMALRERMYRWVGLTVLAGALGRVVFVEVWKLETIYKVLSFMALGLVLLVLGFIYNRYQEKIKEWL